MELIMVRSNKGLDQSSYTGLTSSPSSPHIPQKEEWWQHNIFLTGSDWYDLMIHTGDNNRNQLQTMRQMSVGGWS